LSSRRCRSSTPASRGLLPRFAMPPKATTSIPHSGAYSDRRDHRRATSLQSPRIAGDVCKSEVHHCDHYSWLTRVCLYSAHEIAQIVGCVQGSALDHNERDA